MITSFKTKGTCSTEIHIQSENGKIEKVEFTGGCNGNLKALSALVTGADVNEVIEKLSGIHCGFRQTSCADQLSRALAEHRSS